MLHYHHSLTNSTPVPKTKTINKQQLKNGSSDKQSDKAPYWCMFTVINTKKVQQTINNGVTGENAIDLAFQNMREIKYLAKSDKPLIRL